MKSNTKKNTLLVVLLFIILFLSLYSLKTSSEIKELQNVFKQEKKDLKNALDEMINDYTEVVVVKKGLSKRLRIEVQKMKDLRDSISKIEMDNYN